MIANGNPRVQFGHIPVDVVTAEEAITRIVELSRTTGGTVFTPNVDHVVTAENDPELQAAYAQVTLSVADGMPLVWSSHLLPTALPERVSGSDLFGPLMARATRERLTVYLIGGRPSATALTVKVLKELHPNLEVVGVGPLTREIKADPSRLDEVERDLTAKKPHIAIVALGSPIQEVWSTRIQQRVRPTVLIGLGSGLDVFVGLTPRAPVWMRQSGLEWAFRLAHEPRRLWRRYLRDDPRFLLILARQLRDARARRG